MLGPDSPDACLSVRRNAGSPNRTLEFSERIEAGPHNGPCRGWNRAKRTSGFGLRASRTHQDLRTPGRSVIRWSHDDVDPPTEAPHVGAPPSDLDDGRHSSAEEARPAGVLQRPAVLERLRHRGDPAGAQPGWAGVAVQTPWVAAAVVVLLVIVVAVLPSDLPCLPRRRRGVRGEPGQPGPTAALVAASALMVDYVLTVAVSVAAGVANIVSAFPLAPHAVRCPWFWSRACAGEPSRRQGVRDSIRDPDLRLHR